MSLCDPDRVNGSGGGLLLSKNCYLCNLGLSGPDIAEIAFLL